MINGFHEMPAKVHIGGNCKVKVEDCFNVVHGAAQVVVDKSALEAVNASDAFIRNMLDRCEPVYGINTQFGDQVRFTDPYLFSEDKAAYAASMQKRQESLVKSQYSGQGNPVDRDIVKAAMLIRAHTMSKGYSGVTLGLIEKLVEWIHKDACPEVYQYGSIGASGDLIPLATIAAAVIGQSVPVSYQGVIVDAAQIPIEPYKLKNREGLALINGTALMTAITTLSFHKLEKLFHVMLDLIGMTLEVLHVNPEHYDPLINIVKGHPGSIAVGKRIEAFVVNKAATKSTLQNYYSLRTVAQGFGPFYENVERCKVILEREINAVDDNPICDLEREMVLHGGNFMGYYITEVCDTLKKDIAQASTWIHAILANLYHPRKNSGLPVNIMENSATYSGFLPLQILACSIAVENRKLAVNLQSFMLPTEGDNQDVSSLGTHSALDFRTSVNNLESLCSILFLSATQAWEYREADSMSEYSRYYYSALRARIPKRSEDKLFKPDLDIVKSVIQQLKPLL